MSVAVAVWAMPGDPPVIPAAAFIPAADESGLIVPLGQWVLNEACAQLARWQSELGTARALTLTINITARQLLAPTFVTDVQQAILKAEAEARPIQRKADEEYNKKIEAEWVKQGKVVTHPDIKPFQRAAETIYPQFYDKVGGKDLIDRIRKIGDSM